MIRKADKGKQLSIRGEMAALRRAAKKALKMGLETGTAVWVIKGGRIVDLTKERRKHRPKKQQST